MSFKKQGFWLGITVSIMLIAFGVVSLTNLYYEGWTNAGAFPRPVCRIDATLNEDIKFADIDGSLITVCGGYAYYLNGSIYRLKLDWSSKPEIWDKAAIGKNIISVQKIADNEYKVLYDEKTKSYVLRIFDEKREASGRPQHQLWPEETRGSVSKRLPEGL